MYNNIKKVILMNSKKAQLGFIEMKFFVIGLLVGLVLAVLLVYLSSKGILPLGFLKSMACTAAKGGK